MNIHKLLKIKPYRHPPCWAVYRVLPAVGDVQECYMTVYSLLDGGLTIKITKYTKAPRQRGVHHSYGRILWRNRRFIKLDAAVYALMLLNSTV